jgi:hypothetical protein
MKTKADSAVAGCCCQGAGQPTGKPAYRPAPARSRPPGSRPSAILVRLRARLLAGLLTGLLAALAGNLALAARTLYLAEDELICDGARTICIDGTLGYEVNDRLLWLRGRVQFTTVPGVLQITVKGSNRLGHVRYAPMEIELRGKASEIVDFEMIPDYPDVANWSIDRIVFVPAVDE